MCIDGSDGCWRTLQRVVRAAIGNQAGGRVGFFLEVTDFDDTYRTYTEGGVDFVRAPIREPYGTVAVFRDPFGNLWDLIEPARD